MVASSAFVLAALTMTGIYMKEKNTENKDDGYSVDFEAMEESVDDKFQEIAQNNQESTQEGYSIAQNGQEKGLESPVLQESTGDMQADIEENPTNMENDLDYMPMEAGSSLVEIPGLTDGMYSNGEVLENAGEVLGDAEAIIDDFPEIEEADAFIDEFEEIEELEEEEAASAQNIVVAKELNFSEADGLVRPTAGDILMHYSMDGSVYFATLDQYKYNPAVIFAAEEGTTVSACAEGKVVNVYTDAQIGRAVTIDLGDGYLATYGQLKDVQVKVDSYVNAGDIIGSVAAPTKYYSVEGCNLYFCLTKDGVAVNPENLF